MNREIKFRGMCIMSGKMVEGDLIHGVGSKAGNIYILPRVVNLAYVNHCHPIDGVCVDTKTVGQYTGLKDKNGKEIYEGDIIYQRGQVNTYVEYNKGKWVLRNDTEKAEWRQDLYNKFYLHLEVIGNIYEKPRIITTMNIKQIIEKYTETDAVINGKGETIVTKTCISGNDFPSLSVDLSELMEKEAVAFAEWARHRYIIELSNPVTWHLSVELFAPKESRNYLTTSDLYHRFKFEQWADANGWKKLPSSAWVSSDGERFAESILIEQFKQQ